MSSDTMPCGCEGHMDNLDLCRYPALEEEVKRLRAQVASARAEGFRAAMEKAVDLCRDASLHWGDDGGPALDCEARIRAMQDDGATCSACGKPDAEHMDDFGGES